jgi:hypothetical protein
VAVEHGLDQQGGRFLGKGARGDELGKAEIRGTKLADRQRYAREAARRDDGRHT